MFGHHKKEKPFSGFGGFGGGGLGLAAAGSATSSNIAASGGIIHEFEDAGTKYRAHIFFNPGTFAVTDVPGSHPWWRWCWCW